MKTTQEITKEMLRIGLSNDKELVRTGVAEEINKLAKRGFRLNNGKRKEKKNS